MHNSSTLARVWSISSAGSIPDSYDIYRYLNLVRYSIFDTRYFHRKCNFVDIFRGYLKRLLHVHLLFFKFFFMKHWGKRNPKFFLSKILLCFENPIFIENPNFLSKILFFSLKNAIFFENIRKSGVLSLYIYYFSKTYEIRCLITFRVSLLHRLCRACHTFNI